jgi:hypothetical protein
MKTIVPKQEMKGQALEEEQHDEVRIPADEKKNVPHETSKLYEG